MAKLIWDLVNARTYEGGIDRGVLYRSGVPGVSWNGIVSIEESTPDKKINPIYFDGVKYFETVDTSDFVLELQAFSSPLGFEECVGNKAVRPGVYLTKQNRAMFGLAFRSMVNELNYKIHLVYNATASPTEASSSTLSSSVDPVVFSWTISTVPPQSEIFKPTSHYILDSRKIPQNTMSEIEDILYGTSTTTPRLPTFSELSSILT